VSAPIFISYASSDQKVAETICDALQGRGFACWIACRDIAPGENFQEEIVRAIRSAKLMLLVFSGEANNSNEIKKELVLAGRHHVTVVPVRVEDVAPNDALAYELATRQWIDLFKDWERDVERLADQIGSILAERDGGRPAGTAVVRPSRKRSLPWLLAWVLPVILLAGGGLVYWWAVARPQSSTDERAWSDASSGGTVQALREYVASSPNGRHVAEAEQRIRSADDKAWTDAVAVGTMVAFNRYLSDFSDGAHVAQAHRALTGLEKQILEQHPGADKDRFDGVWRTSITCSGVGETQRFTLQFISHVKNGFFHGERGVEGEPSWLSFDGKIELDGSADLFGHGLTGDPKYSGVPPGTPYDYHIPVRFEDVSATGKRVGQRQCDFNAFKR
jgi:hypothetical protein